MRAKIGTLEEIQVIVDNEDNDIDRIELLDSNGIIHSTSKYIVYYDKTKTSSGIVSNEINEQCDNDADAILNVLGYSEKIKTNHLLAYEMKYDEIRRLIEINKSSKKIELVTCKDKTYDRHIIGKQLIKAMYYKAVALGWYDEVDTNE